MILFKLVLFLYLLNSLGNIDAAEREYLISREYPHLITIAAKRCNTF